MNDRKRFMEETDKLIDKLLRPLCEECGKIPQQDPDRKYCLYCEMVADWCQCDASDFCKCHENH